MLYCDLQSAKYLVVLRLLCLAWIYAQIIPLPVQNCVEQLIYEAIECYIIAGHTGNGPLLASFSPLDRN